MWLIGARLGEEDGAWGSAVLGESERGRSGLVGRMVICLCQEFGFIRVLSVFPLCTVPYVSNDEA